MCLSVMGWWKAVICTSGRGLVVVSSVLSCRVLVVDRCLSGMGLVVGSYIPFRWGLGVR
jgi:hypothetical protein